MTGRLRTLFCMTALYFTLAGILIAATVVPLSHSQHWTVRIFDFAKLQFFVLQVLVLLLFGARLDWTTPVLLTQIALFASAVYNGSVLFRYTPFYPLKAGEPPKGVSNSMTIVSANVLQFNTEYSRFIQLIRQVDPDMFLTMESNEDWDTAMIDLQSDYPHFHKVPLENTYGIHLYSKIPLSSQTHYFVADDLPSIEARVTCPGGYRFTVFCVHPPPPSPTEEETSKERDGELLSVAKRIKESGATTLVVGDFNNVAWSRSSTLFRKLSETIDPRIGRGFTPTFHSRYWFAQFPIDQVFHTPDIFVEELKALPDFGSDHLALYVRFHINRYNDEQEELVEEIEAEELEVVEEMIEEGIKEESTRREDEVADE